MYGVCNKTKLVGVWLEKKPKGPSKCVSAKEEQLGPCLQEVLVWASGTLPDASDPIASIA